MQAENRGVPDVPGHPLIGVTRAHACACGGHSDQHGTSGTAGTPPTFGSDVLPAVLALDLGTTTGWAIRTHDGLITSGTVSLHDKRGVPLRELGTGSIRLLVAGLQRQAAAQTNITLLDELEYGLEPHRIIRLLGSLGAKEKPAPLQVFATTHSPVAVRELAAEQLYVVRSRGDCSEARRRSMSLTMRARLPCVLVKSGGSVPSVMALTSAMSDSRPCTSAAKPPIS